VQAVGNQLEIGDFLASFALTTGSHSPRSDTGDRWILGSPGRPALPRPATAARRRGRYRWAYLFLSFGLLVLVAYRSFVHHESPWDLLLLVILGGGVGTAYQGRHRVRRGRRGG
jgi:hypothetical protein